MAILSVERLPTVLGTVYGGIIGLSLNPMTFASEDFLDVFTGDPLPEGLRYCRLNVTNNSQVPFSIQIQAATIFTEVLPGQSYRYDLYALGGSAGISTVTFLGSNFLINALGALPSVTLTAEFLP